MDKYKITQKRAKLASELVESKCREQGVSEKISQQAARIAKILVNFGYSVHCAGITAESFIIPLMKNR